MMMLEEGLQDAASQQGSLSPYQLEQAKRKFGPAAFQERNEDCWAEGYVIPEHRFEAELGNWMDDIGAPSELRNRLSLWPIVSSETKE
ncbi:MAG: hypothetical protein GY696_23570 [Gammaproteobacteria bacterium]|nr:hypothetical protein [Gammaproteobacteria bacterium]